MKKSILLLIAMQIAFVCNAWEPKATRYPERGYRGFVDVDFTVGKERGNAYYGKGEPLWYLGLSTSHGFQFDNKFFLGGGLMVSPVSSNKDGIIPVFAHFRFDTEFSNFTPFGDIRLGYNIADGDKGTGVYFSPSVGYRFNWGRKLNLNLSLGMTVLGTKYSDYDYIPQRESEGYYNVFTKRGADVFFTVRLGIDF